MRGMRTFDSRFLDKRFVGLNKPVNVRFKFSLKCVTHR
jgi:hypothetical protein